MRILKGFLRLGAALTLCSSLATAAHAAPPQTVSLPAGLNLGGTSFFDAVGSTEPGFVFLDYARTEYLNKFTGSDGRTSPGFPNAPRFNVVDDIPQFIYISPFKLGTGAFGFTALFPVVGFDTSFPAGDAPLKDNGIGFGDITFGPLYQSAPIISGGRPVFFWRAEFDVIAPVGKFDPTRDINQSSGYWSLNPYLTMTALPTPEIELSARFYYLYNLETTRFANPQPVPGGLSTGQAGQAAWVNFTASYEVLKNVSFGLNGYYLKQLENNKTNGVEVPMTRAEELYLGPGMHVLVDKHNIMNVNVYLPVETRNLAQGTQLNLQYIHPF
jgi:hypothetical protein